jgi:hypothetical protein
MKKIIITESQFYRLMNEDEVIDELDYNSFQNDENLESLRKAINSNKVVSVAYVKKDGTVKHMAIKKNISAYVASDKEKTDKQKNVQQNNNIKFVIDVNAYKKKLREFDGDKTLAAKNSWRSINLQSVLGFMVGGRFIDLREENDIMGRFGETIYNQLTKGMIRSMEMNNNEIEQEIQEWV